MASQLEGRAPPGGILLSEETHRLVRDAVRAEPVDDAWKLDEVLVNTPAYARRLEVPLVGREEELQRLLTAYTNARDDRHCRVVTVVGEAGIGKTRLGREFVASVREEARVLVGRCVSYGEGATYLPIAEIVRQAAAEPSLDGIRALLDGEEDADSVAQRVAELDRGRGISSRSWRGVLGRAPAARVDRAQRAGRGRTRRHPLGRADAPRPRGVPRRVGGGTHPRRLPRSR